MKKFVKTTPIFLVLIILVFLTGCDVLLDALAEANDTVDPLSDDSTTTTEITDIVFSQELPGSNNLIGNTVTWTSTGSYFKFYYKFEGQSGASIT